jgi:hypothetical protein
MRSQGNIPMTSINVSRQADRKTQRKLIIAIVVLFGTFVLLGVPIWNPKISIWMAEAVQAEFVGTNLSPVP